MSSGLFTFKYLRKYEEVVYIHMYTQRNSSGLFTLNYLRKYEEVVYIHMYT
jgi:hypothetical protein